jgi:hypothetical protein
MVRNDCGLTVLKRSEEMNINRESMGLTFTKDLNIQIVHTKVVPKNLVQAKHRGTI